MDVKGVRNLKTPVIDLEGSGVISAVWEGTNLRGGRGLRKVPVREGKLSIANSSNIGKTDENLGAIQQCKRVKIGNVLSGGRNLQHIGPTTRWIVRYLKCGLLCSNPIQ